MGNVVATLRVMPISPEVDLKNLKNKIEDLVPENMKFHKITEEPIAFGLVALNVVVLAPDDEGGDLTPFEEKIQELEEVSGVEVTDVRRTF